MKPYSKNSVNLREMLEQKEDTDSLGKHTFLSNIASITSDISICKAMQVISNGSDVSHNVSVSDDIWL